MPRRCVPHAVWRWRWRWRWRSVTPRVTYIIRTVRHAYAHRVITSPIARHERFLSPDARSARARRRRWRRSLAHSIARTRCGDGDLPNAGTGISTAVALRSSLYYHGKRCGKKTKKSEKKRAAQAILMAKFDTDNGTVLTGNPCERGDSERRVVRRENQHFNGPATLRVGNTPWFRRVRWALCSCCLTPAPGEEAGGSGQNVDAVLLHAWRWAEPPARLPPKKTSNTQTRTKPRSSFDIGLSFCFAPFSNNNNNLRPPGAYRAMSHGAWCLL